MKPAQGQALLLAPLAMVAFASNSLLNRLALGGRMMDAASYTAVRLISGALMLLALASLRRKKGLALLRGSWVSAAWLFAYAITFSLAYLSLSTGTGALILFGSVQITMIALALRSGERPRALEWTGLFLALGGLVVLVLPGLEAPSPLGSALMAAAGIAWAVYSLRGRGTQDPLADTAGNFVYSVPMVVVVWAGFSKEVHVTPAGGLYAAVSGALASGVGYVIWYTALRGLTAARAGTVQLSVPVIAAWSGVALLSESVSARLILAGVLILGGIALALSGRAKD